MDPMIASSLISTGGSLLGGLFGRKKSNSYWTEYAYERANRLIREDRARADSVIQRTVADAKAAGLHPLFALGAGGAQGGGGVDMSGPPSIYEPPESGSLVGDVFETLGDGMASYIRGREQSRERELEATRQERLDNAAVRAAEARARRDEAEAALAHSEAKRMQQAANHTRPAMTETPFNQRPLESLPRESHPNKVTATGERGGDYYSYAPPSLGGDEINQVIWTINRAIETVSDVAAQAFPQGRKLEDEKAARSSMERFYNLRRSQPDPYKGLK